MSKPNPDNDNERIIKRSLPVTLTDDERRDRGSELANNVEAYSALEAQKKSMSAALNATMQEVKRKTFGLTSAVSTGIEYRDVECREIFYVSFREVTVVRTDTGETVETRPMTEAEYKERVQLRISEAPAQAGPMAEGATSGNSLPPIGNFPEFPGETGTDSGTGDTDPQKGPEF